MADTHIQEKYITEPLPAIRSGVTGEAQSISQGGTQASGTITFADNPTATDTITLNGIYAEFTAAASDATAAGTVGDPLLINIKASTDLTLDEMLVVLNDAGAPAAAALATYTEDGATILTATYDTNGTVGNAFTLAASADTVSGATLTGGQDTGVIFLTTENNDISLTQSVDQDFTLADGVPSQRKTIALSLKSGAGNAVITPTNFTDGTTITLDTVNDYAELQFVVDAWKIVGVQVATVA